MSSDYDDKNPVVAMLREVAAKVDHLSAMQMQGSAGDEANVEAVEAQTAAIVGALRDVKTAVQANAVSAPSAKTPWLYTAASGGLLSTTAIVLKTAAGAGKRNYLTALQMTLGAAIAGTVAAVRDKGGTVLWRGAIAPGGVVSVSFPDPIAGSDNQDMELVLASSVSLAVFVNAQGYSA